LYIKIGRLARYFRISPQTIRYYEEKGFLRPWRSSDGGDRQYHLRTLKLLSSIRQYHNMGFGTKDIQELFGMKSLSDIDNRLSKQQARLDREMEQLAFRQNALHRKREHIARIHRLLGTCELAPLEPIFLLINRQDNRIIEDEATLCLMERWIVALPIVEGAVRVSMDAVLTCDASHGRESGYCLWESDAAQLNLPLDAPAERISWPLCIHTVLLHAQDKPIYEGALAFAEAHGLTVCGSAIQRVLAKVGEFQAAGEEVIPQAVYYECWIPVKYSSPC